MHRFFLNYGNIYYIQLFLRLDSINRFKKYDLDHYIAEDRNTLNNLLLNQLDRIERYLAKENLSLNTLVMMENEYSPNEPEYKKWLLKAQNNVNIDQILKNDEYDGVQQRRNSFDFIDLNKGNQSFSFCL
jgi:hypothetical protein